MLELVTHEVLTKSLTTPRLPEGDLQVVKSYNDSQLFNDTDAQVKPELLLGCDCVWRFWKADSCPIPLPSGLHMVHTRLGNIFTGQISRPNPVFYCSESELEKWDEYWSLEF